MKRAIAFILVALILSIMAACGPAAAPETITVVETVVVEKEVQGETITVVETVEVIKTVEVVKEVEVEKEKPKLSVWLMDGILPEQLEWFQKVVYQFAVENNVDVEIYHGPEEAYVKKIQAGLESGQLPDVWMSLEFLLPAYLKAGAITDLSDVLAELDTQSGGLADGIIPAMTYDDKQWGIPHQVWADATFVRKDLLEAKGLEPPQTYADVVEVAKAVADPTTPIYGWGMHLGQCADATAEMHSMIWSYGGTVWGEDGKTVELKSPETMAAIEVIKEAWEADAMVPDSPNWDCYGNNACYLEGTCAIIQNAGSVYVEMRDNNPELLEKTIIVPDPAGPAQQYNFTNYEPWVMSSKSQNPEVAKAFLKYLYDPDRQLEYMRLMKGFNFPIYQDHAKDEMWNDPYLKPFLEDSARSRTAGWPGPNSAWVQEASSQYVLVNMINRVLIDGEEIETAVDDAVKQLEEIRDSFQ